METMITCLDHGYVRLVDSMGTDISIVRAARVSYAAQPRGDGQDERLLRYLLEHKHTSPFEHVQFTFEVCAPIFVFRQWHRHRTWSFNEVSGRYTALPEACFVPAPDTITTQSTSNKQMRTAQLHPDAARFAALIRASNLAARIAYEKLLEEGCPRELARVVLPLSQYSSMFATVDLHNLLHFLELRLHEHAQREIQVYAEAMLELVRQVVPATITQWENLRG